MNYLKIMGTSNNGYTKCKESKYNETFFHTQSFTIKSIHLWFKGHCEISRIPNINIFDTI